MSQAITSFPNTSPFYFICSYCKETEDGIQLLEPCTSCLSRSGKMGTLLEEMERQRTTAALAIKILKNGKIEIALKLILEKTHLPSVRLFFFKKYAVTLCKLDNTNLFSVLKKAPEICMGVRFQNSLVKALEESELFGSSEAIESMIAAYQNWNNTRLLFLGGKDAHSDLHKLPPELRSLLLSAICRPKIKQ